ncbi:amidohydrolase [Globicatella sulfidifaciens]|uniref:Amidohydrolase n=1 Tax=Globicatella sulfidifaciens DSM 15739 TaxID=1121925 RepID=A0A1T4MZ56_9LACT|nr:amidohydrolase [Globicatella sulfidifaciens]SJZ72134.1 amidohydrolase [Globicatella sulfidifaciens DSM 15739]
MNTQIKHYILEHEDELIQNRRYLHRHPELSLQEFKTTQFIAQELDKLKVPYRLMEATGVLAEIKGLEPGKTVLLRADMDALSIDELNHHLDYYSVEVGKMHACGHDAHTSMLLSALKALFSVKDQIKGTVRFIFQPAEEIGQGAKKMVEQGVLEDVDNVFGIHIWSVHETGQVVCDPGPSFASADIFKIHFKGKGGHAAQPHLSHDAVVMAAEYVNNVQSIISRAIDPLSPAVLTIGKFEAGDRFNIIAENAVLEGTVRTFNNETRSVVATQMQAYAEQIAEMYHGSVEFDYSYVTEVVDNHLQSAQLVQSITEQTFGKDFVHHDDPTMGAEDFGYYMKTIPGAFATVGCRNVDKETDFPHHHARFNVDEEALKYGAELYAQYALRYLNQGEF